MKTFLEWLELNEAGFFGNLFGKKAQPVQQPQIEKSAEEKEQERLNRAHDEAMALLVPGYKPRERTPEPQQKPAQAISKPVVSPQSAVSRVGGGQRKSSGTTLFDQLYDLAGDRMYLIKKLKLQSDRSLGIEANRSALYEVYSNLSRAKNYYPPQKDEAKGLSDSEVDRAISIIEKMFNEELGLTTFPNEEFVYPFAKSDWDSNDYRVLEIDYINNSVDWPHPALVVVKGFRGRKTTPARVSIGSYARKYGVEEEQ